MCDTYTVLSKYLMIGRNRAKKKKEGKKEEMKKGREGGEREKGKGREER